MTPSEPNNSKPHVQSKVDFHQDQILGGRYRVLSLLGEGGMGVVYKVEQIFLGKELALKTIGKSEQTDLILRRFETEARAVFSVNHPNIIAVHDFGLLDDQTPFLAMELVNGKTLGQILKSRQLSADEAIPLFIQVCFGLAHAHESGIVHRDVKPNNIMILNDHSWGTEGSVKILDFGIAKLAQHEGGEIQALTRTGEIFGSPVYMSPEQCLGGKIDHRSDIYSLGCVLFEALTGAPPFVGENAMNTMMMHQQATVPTLKEASLGQEFPPALEQIVHRMLEKNPDQRYQNLGYAAHDLADIKRGSTGAKSSAVTVPRPVKADVSAPNLVKIEKSHFYLILLSTAALCAILTSTIMQIMRPIKPTLAVQESAPPPIEETSVMPGPQSDLDVAMDDYNIQDIKKRIAQGRTKFSAAGWPTDKSLEVFKNYKDAQFVELTDCAVTDAGLKNLNKSKVLELSLAGDKNVETVDEIAKLEYLQRLNLKDTGITDSALPKLAKLPMLDQLDISGCNISQKALTALTSSNCLTVVTLSNNKYSKEFVGQLQTKFPQCTFQPLFRQPKVVEEEEENAKTHPTELQRYEHLLSLVSKANSNCKSAAQYCLGIAVEKAKAGLPKEASKYAKRAKSISERTGDLKQLATELITESYQLQPNVGRKEAIALFDRLTALDVATNMHDDHQLLDRILRATRFLREAGQYEKVIEYCQLGERLLAQFKFRNAEYLPIFDEKIGWSYYQLKQPLKGAVWCQRSLDYWRMHQNDHPKTDLDRPGKMEIPRNLYARALIEMGHSESNTAKSKALYDEALKLLDSLALPEDIDLNEHYCDACNHMADIYLAESNSAKSLEYLKKGLAAVKQLRHEDENNRMKFFTDKIANQEKS